MHDPYIVIKDFKPPLPLWLWRRYRDDRRKHPGSRFLVDPRPTLFTLWHKDPEIGGDDDSCEFSGLRARLTEREEKLCRELADWEREHPYYFACPTRIRNPKYRYHEINPGDALGVVLALWNCFAWRLDRRELTTKEIRKAIGWATWEGNNLQSSFAFDPDDTNPSERILGAIRNACKLWRAVRRPWWKSAKLHVHHWRLSSPYWYLLRRWLFQRCEKCGGRFRWGESACSGWDGGAIWHTRCDEAKVAPTEEKKTP